MPVSMLPPVERALPTDLDQRAKGITIAPRLPRLQLVTVTLLTALCPVCGGPRPWNRKYCGDSCMRKSRSDRWRSAHRGERRVYWRDWRRAKVAKERGEAAK